MDDPFLGIDAAAANVSRLWGSKQLRRFYKEPTMGPASIARDLGDSEFWEKRIFQLSILRGSILREVNPSRPSFGQSSNYNCFRQSDLGRLLHLARNCQRKKEIRIFETRSRASSVIQIRGGIKPFRP